MPNPEPPYFHEYDSLQEVDAASRGEEAVHKIIPGTVECVLENGARIQIQIDPLNPGRIQIQTPDGLGLLVYPRMSNTIHVSVEPFRKP